MNNAGSLTIGEVYQAGYEALGTWSNHCIASPKEINFAYSGDNQKIVVKGSDKKRLLIRKI